MEENKDQVTPSSEAKGKRSDIQNSLLLYLHDLVTLLAGILLVLLLLFRIVIVSGPSMNNTLLDGDYLLLLSNNLYPNPKHGDIIVASKESFDNGAPIVKRVIATGGQTVDIDFATGSVYVDDALLKEDYINELTFLEEGTEFPLTVPEGSIFVMGDNRNHSSDSRDSRLGTVDTRYVIGKAVMIAFPGADAYTGKRDMKRIGAIG